MIILKDRHMLSPNLTRLNPGSPNPGAQRFRQLPPRPQALLRGDQNQSNVSRALPPSPQGVQSGVRPNLRPLPPKPQPVQPTVTESMLDSDFSNQNQQPSPVGIQSRRPQRAVPVPQPPLSSGPLSSGPPSSGSAKYQGALKELQARYEPTKKQLNCLIRDYGILQSDPSLKAIQQDFLKINIDAASDVLNYFNEMNVTSPNLNIENVYPAVIIGVNAVKKCYDVMYTMFNTLRNKGIPFYDVQLNFRLPNEQDTMQCAAEPADLKQIMNQFMTRVKLPIDAVYISLFKDENILMDGVFWADIAIPNSIDTQRGLVFDDKFVANVTPISASIQDLQKKSAASLKILHNTVEKYNLLNGLMETHSAQLYLKLLLENTVSSNIVKKVIHSQYGSRTIGKEFDKNALIKVRRRSGSN